MAKYKVKVIAHQLKNQVIAKFDEVVDESQLNGNASELEKQGFVEKVKEPAKEEKVKETAKESKK